MTIMSLAGFPTPLHWSSPTLWRGAGIHKRGRAGAKRRGVPFMASLLGRNWREAGEGQHSAV